MGKIIDKPEYVEVQIDREALLEGTGQSPQEIISGGNEVIAYAWHKLYSLAVSNEAVKKMWSNAFCKSEAAFDEQKQIFIVRFLKDNRSIDEVLNTGD
jgi:hypothetical protein